MQLEIFHVQLIKDGDVHTYPQHREEPTLNNARLSSTITETTLHIVAYLMVYFAID